MCFQIQILNIDGGIMYNNLLKYSYHYIDFILLSYLPEVTIYILCLNNLINKIKIN